VPAPAISRKGSYCPNPSESNLIQRHPRWPQAASVSLRAQSWSGESRVPGYFPTALAMQKVVGSNPISRFEKRLQIAGVSSSAAG
jgi:hypothetical protein